MRCAILDDYQNVALSMADWSKVTGDVDITVFNKGLGDLAAIAEALQDFEIICLMRERTPFPRALFEKLPKLKLLVTSGARNLSIDMAAAKDHGVTVCGTDGAKHPTAELAIGLMLDLARNISIENARIKPAKPGNRRSAAIFISTRLAFWVSAILAAASPRWRKRSACAFSPGARI